MTYAEIRERIVQGVIRSSANPPPLDRVRAVIDASFFQINSQVAEAFAAREDKRELLRKDKIITFTNGEGAIPSDVLKKYLEDGTFTVDVTPVPRYAFRRWPDYLRSTDRRLGYWSTRGETIAAKKPATGAALSGDALTTFICSPAVPTSETQQFVAPDDYIPELIDAFIQFITGQTAETAAESAAGSA